MSVLEHWQFWGLPPLDTAQVRRQVGDATVDRILDLDERLSAKAQAYARFWSTDYDCGIVEARRHAAELAASLRDYDRQQWRKALHALWFAPPNSTSPQVWGQDDALDGVKRWRAFWTRLLCTMVMISGRRGIRHRRGRQAGRWAGWCSRSVVFWDSHSDSYGWSAQILEFHPWQLRYSLISDGECTM